MYALIYTIINVFWVFCSHCLQLDERCPVRIKTGCYNKKLNWIGFGLNFHVIVYSLLLCCSILNVLANIVGREWVLCDLEQVIYRKWFTCSLVSHQCIFVHLFVCCSLF